MKKQAIKLKVYTTEANDRGTEYKTQINTSTGKYIIYVCTCNKFHAGVVTTDTQIRATQYWDTIFLTVSQFRTILHLATYAEQGEQIFIKYLLDEVERNLQ